MSDSPIISVQAWPAFQKYMGQKDAFWPHLTSVFQHYVSAGCVNWEGGADDESQFECLLNAMAATGMRMPSAYMGGCFHDVEPATKEDEWLKRLRFARALGAKWVVCNPDPVSWSQPQRKSDSQLELQLRSFHRLAELARAENLQLALHWHFPEFESGACELWYMLTRTDPDLVKICFDVQWTHQGLGYSSSGMFSLLDYLWPRILSFHVRQTRDGVFWPEFGSGDIDYRAWSKYLQRRNWQGMIVLEQCRHERSPVDPDFWRSQHTSVQNLKEILW